MRHHVVSGAPASSNSCSRNRWVRPWPRWWGPHDESSRGCWCGSGQPINYNSPKHRFLNRVEERAKILVSQPLANEFLPLIMSGEAWHFEQCSFVATKCYIVQDTSAVCTPTPFEVGVLVVVYQILIRSLMKYCAPIYKPPHVMKIYWTNFNGGRNVLWKN